LYFDEFDVQIEGQLKRLLTQLQDIESMKDEFDDEDEYQSTRKVSKYCHFFGKFSTYL
jgi:hypothetical protein